MVLKQKNEDKNWRRIFFYSLYIYACKYVWIGINGLKQMDAWAHISQKSEIFKLPESK